MKFLTYIALVASTAAVSRRHVPDVTFVETLPDVRPDLVTEGEIAAKEGARSTAATVKKNPQAALLASIKADLEQVNNDMSFGISYSQNKRNDHGQALVTKVSNAIVDYTNKLIGVTNSQPNESLTEQNAHNIAAMIFYDVQAEDAGAALAMPKNEDLVLAVNRLKSLQKLYLFEQKGGENYLG